MALRKFTRTDSNAEVVSLEGHQALQSELEKLNKSSARDLSEGQRQDLRLALDESEEQR